LAKKEDKVLNFVKLSSITIRSVSETGRKGAGFGTVEETQWAGRYIRTPQPEAHELRVAQLIIFISGARVFSFIQIIIENTPSSEPDELSIILTSGSWRVFPYASPRRRNCIFE